MLAAELLGFTSTLTTTTTETGGVVVTEASALKFPAVWAAVQCIAGDVASLPFFHYRRLSSGGKERYTTSKLYRVLHDEFNPEMSAMVARETMTAHLLLWGNAYAEIIRNDLGQVVALYPIEPNRVQPDRTDGGAIVYRVATSDGTEVTIPAARILHLVGLGWNGLMGYPVISLMRQSLGSGLAAEKLGSDIMSRGAKYSGFFEHPRTLGATALKNIKESLATDLPGTYRILEEGMTYKPGSMPLSDAQFMEQRKFSVTEVARIFGIPPHKIGDLERATFSNVEEENASYVTNTLRRWLQRWEQECNRKLIAPLEKSQQYTEHLVDGLMRGKTLDRFTALNMAINAGWMSFNEARDIENMNPIPGGDTHVVQGAMVPLARLDDLIDRRVTAPPGPAPPEAEAEDEAEDAAAQMERVLWPALEELRAELVRRTAGLETLPAAVVAALPPPPAPTPQDDPRRLMVAFVAGKLVRREVAQLKKRAADPTAAAMRLERFYRRFLTEGVAELHPWLSEAVATRHLTAWVEAAVAEWAPALAEGTLGAVVARWEQDRAATLTRVLTEAIDG
jgi:HK97 family phage portal protein